MGRESESWESRELKAFVMSSYINHDNRAQRSGTAGAQKRQVLPLPPKEA